MSKKMVTISLCFSLFLVSAAFAPMLLAAGVVTEGDLDVNGWIWSKSGGFKFPDGTTWTTGSMSGLLFNVGFVVDDSNSNAGNLNSGAIKFGTGATGEAIASQRIGSGNVNGIDFYTNSAARLSITNSGYVGIGTRTPDFPLTVTSGNWYHARFGTHQPTYIGSFPSSFGANMFWNGANWKYGTDGYAGIIMLDNPGLKFATTGSGTGGGNAAPTWGMKLMDGKLRVGNSSDPTEVLDVTGNIKASGALTAVNGNFIGSLNLDQGNTNNGVLNGPVLTFGLSSGEGIASKRTEGGNRYGLDFYTGFTKRMSISQAGNIGIGADAPAGYKVYVAQDAGTGLYATTTALNGNGIVGVANNGSSAWAIYGWSTSGYAGHFAGKVNVTGNLDVGGTLTKSGGSFKIDHPLDPANKYLYHSFVESPDMKNIYDGIAVLDGNGEAVVDLPDWFQELNRDFRYQLTSIGAPGPDLYVADEVNNNSFRIAGGKANGKVSWQLTGIRKDAWANAHRIPVEENKPAEEAGTYTHPELYGQPETMGVQHRMKK